MTFEWKFSKVQNLTKLLFLAQILACLPLKNTADKMCLYDNQTET